MPVDDKEAWAAAASAGRKGYGPLASTSARLTQQIAYTGPGPGSYTPQTPSSRRAAGSDAGSAAFCTTGRSFSASGSNSSSRPAPGPGAHGVPALAYTGASLQWGSQQRPGAAAAFRTPPRSSAASATQLREQLQQQKYADGTPVPWLLSPPKQAGGRPLPGPRLVQSAHPRSCSARAAHEHHPQGAAAVRVVLGACSSSAQQGRQNQLAGLVCPSSAAAKPSTGSGRSSWQLQDSIAAVPGPGAYETHKIGALQDRPLRSAFMQPLVQDRFGASTLRRPQPPATQQQQQQAAQEGHAQHNGGAACRHGHACSPPASRQPGVSAGFRSRSPGHAQALLAAADAGMAGAPGPSYYSPQPPPHKVSYRQGDSAHTFVAAV